MKHTKKPLDDIEDLPSIEDIVSALRSLADLAADEIERLASDNSMLVLDYEQLLEALRPFAELAETEWINVADDNVLCDLMRRDLRRARDLIARIDKG